MFTWGFAPCASPQAVTGRAFSLQNDQTPLRTGTVRGPAVAVSRAVATITDDFWLDFFRCKQLK
jgi:hypothetical protein